MLTHTEVRTDRRRCLALTGLTPTEFDLLLPAFARCCERLSPTERTAAGRPRQRFPGGGRTGALPEPGQKLLFVLVYLKTYPLQAVMAELFGLSQPRVNYWLRQLLPILRDALDELGALPERDPHAFGEAAAAGGQRTRRIIDGTERRRQRPRNREKQAAHYSGRKKIHSYKNVVVARAASQRIEFLSQTYVGRVSDKRIADGEGIAYPPGTILYKDTGFQGYEPAVAATRQAKKKATGGRADRGGEASQPQVGPHPRPSGARLGRREAQPHRQRRAAEHP
jgi:hypothetical protein